MRRNGAPVKPRPVDDIHDAVANGEEQYSIWPIGRTAPAGWAVPDSAAPRRSAWPTSPRSGWTCDHGRCARRCATARPRGNR
ncbi:MbtH family NRPS accessory protein [Salinispora vitiensis]|uniref:MbtH family NRPS accessory protein n=1 Tax=Salinispora vitiensis TaxID=999544 RepID=UPI0037C587CE